MGRRICTASTMMTATQTTNAPPAATAITPLRWSDSSEDDTSMNKSNPLSRTAAIGSTAFSVQLMWRLRTTVSAGFTGHGVTVSWFRIGVGPFTLAGCSIQTLSLNIQNIRAGGRDKKYGA